MVTPAGEWRWELFQQYLPREVLLRIAAIKVMPQSDCRDIIGWNASTNGGFSVSSAYQIRCGHTILAVNKRHKGFTRLPILNQIPALIDKAWEVQVCRVPRRVNRAADGMAKVARFDSLECDGFEVPPAVTIALLRLDALEA
ncbi:hypothetical protein V6N13_122090 [Hibiscus sabdariffa]